jgi:4a-hydroxytetrahydrobiopterin dehydratase
VLTRQITFKSFARAMAFLNRLAEIAEREGHHPDFCLERWNHITLSLTTHAIGGLSRNDFVLAAKLQAAIRPPTET